MGCRSGKMGYATKQLAEDAMYFAMSFSDGKRRAPVRSYYCGECGRYHLTSQHKGESSDVRR